MGKASETTMVTQTTNPNPNPNPNSTKKKKRGRPSLSDLQNRQLQSPISISNPNLQNPNQFLPRRTPNFLNADDYSDDDARLQKKLRLVHRIPISHFQDEKGWKGTDTDNGTRMLDIGPTTCATTTPLPGNKKLLLLILEKLQKKDTRGVFAEPVDLEELPDYQEVIENPMDFGTVRKKLCGGVYLTLEQLEEDIYLICSNAMEYNGPSTIYFRQARSIQELAKKEFDVLRQESGNSEPPPRPRRGRPPGSRNMKKLLESSALDSTARESSSDATPASRDDDTMRSNSYNLRKGPSLYRFPRNLEASFDFTASASKSIPMKCVERQYDSEESRRETYNPIAECGSSQDPSLQLIFEPHDKKLIPVGLDFEHTYARSLTQFAMDLGPVVWRFVSKKLRNSLPPEAAFGQGWVGESKMPFMQHSSPLPEKSVQPESLSQESFRAESLQQHPSTSGFANFTMANIIPPSSHSNEGLVEASRNLNPKNDWSSLKGPNVQPGMNGFNGSFGPGFHFEEGGGVSMKKTLPLPFNPGIKSHSNEPNSSYTPRSLTSSTMNPSASDFQDTLRAENENMGVHGVPYWQNVSMEERWDLPYQADQQNMGFLHASDSRSSSLPNGSPPPLDLVLQL